jgi:hypothetical protein
VSHNQAVKFQGNIELGEKDQRALNDIDEYGCHVLNVMEGEGESIGSEKE